jgi:Uma2 family endonuclease
MATSVHRKLTYGEFQDLPREEVGRRMLELIEGEVFVTPAPKTIHQVAAGNLHFALRKFLEQRNLGRVLFAPYDVVFSEWTALEPDLLFVRRDRLSILTEANARGAPDLVIEILSPSNRVHDRVRKHRIYEEAGVPELWYVDPEDRTVEIINLGPDRRYAVTARFSEAEAIVSKTLPGFSLMVDEVFAD